MILEAKKTTVAYRCPHCGSGVVSMIRTFSVGADMVKLKWMNGEYFKAMDEDRFYEMAEPVIREVITK